MFLLASVLLCVCVLVVPGTSVTCNIDPSDSCKCSFADGGKTWNIDISKYFDYPAHPKPVESKYTYTYTCYNAKCPKNPNSTAVACQYVENQGDYPLGKVDQHTTWEVTDTSDSSLTFVITYKNGQKSGDKTRETTVTFKYATGNMEMKVTKEDNTDTNINYEMEASGKEVKKFSPSGGKGKSGGKKTFLDQLALSSSY
ncbi:hypothetical protein GBAR_LOCUS24159, partial [Geodia barretti]